jgi:hypothetical protein
MCKITAVIVREKASLPCRYCTIDTQSCNSIGYLERNESRYHSARLLAVVGDGLQAQYFISLILAVIKQSYSSEFTVLFDCV